MLQLGAVGSIAEKGEGHGEPTGDPTRGLVQSMQACGAGKETGVVHACMRVAKLL